jgi:uncharacterized membrane protein
MNRRIVYFHHSLFILAVLSAILALAVGLIFIGVVGVAFREVGFSLFTTVFILVATLVGSFVNIPIMRLRSTLPIVKEERTSFFGMVYRIPRVEYDERMTTIAINLGGAVIPSIVSFYLLYKSGSAILYALTGVVVVAIVTHLAARTVRGVGIVTPSLIPPIAAVMVSILLPSGAPKIVAYVSGVLGTIIGADLSNLGAISGLGAPIASIGGAGTFDGVFLSGIVAVLLV